MTKLNTLLKDSAYKLTQFSSAQIEALENRIIDKEIRGKVTPHVVCLVRNKEIKLTPEEVVRQLFIDSLHQKYGYPLSRMQCEWVVTQGSDSTSKRADVVIFDVDRPTEPYIIVEIKKSNSTDGVEQLKSYCNWANAPVGVWTNGVEMECFFKRFSEQSKSNFLDKLTHLPHCTQTLADVLNERFTIKDLIEKDELKNKTLRDLVLEFENIVLANSGVDAFEEIFKLIFTKLFDEWESRADKENYYALLGAGVSANDIDKNNSFRNLEFRNSGTDSDVKRRLENLFEGARQKWEGIFPEDCHFELTPSHLNSCVSYLQVVKLFNSNLDVVDDAFEYLINKSSKGDKGQYFTPRYVIDMCVQMLNPKASETLIDTAAGSCGFPMHSIFHVWRALEPDQRSHAFTTDKRTPAQTRYVERNVFAMDFDPRVVRIGRTLNLIAGDGQTNVLELNTLDYKGWQEVTTQKKWYSIYQKGFERLSKLRPPKCDEYDYSRFEFDIVMANPPFAGDIVERMMPTLSSYELSKNANGKRASKVSRDILFIERNLNFLKAGGRMAIVLPQGVFNNSSDKHIREFIASQGRILAVVGLHGNVFKPHTGTKTSVLFVQKWTDDDGICPRKDDYPIFFATMQEPSKDNSGDKIELKDEQGSFLLDSHGHKIVKHDLFDLLIHHFKEKHDESRDDIVKKLKQNGLSDTTINQIDNDGIAEAFIEFAKKENLSFFDSSPFDEVKYRALLEGLVINEVMLSKMRKSERLDANFAAFPERHYLQNVLKNNKCKAIGEIASYISSGHTPYLHNVKENGDVDFVTVECVSDLTLHFDKLKSISFEHFNNEFKRNRLTKGSVLCTIKRRICKAFPITKDYGKVAFNQDIAFITPNEEVNPIYLATFLCSKIGQLLANRQMTEQMNPYISVENLSKLPIIILTQEFQKKIELLFLDADKLREQSKNLYSQAENLLLDALGMADFSPSNENINIKSFNDSFVSTGRLDAEYYQPKYEDYEFYIINNSKGYTTVGNEYNLVKSSSKREKLAYNYIEISDVNVSDGAASFNRIEIEELPANAKQEVKRGDLLISKVRPNRGAVAIIDFDDTDLIVSGAFTVLREKVNSEFSNETLKVLLRTKMYRDWLLKFNVGTQYPVIRDEDILSLPIPKIERETQIKIAALVQQSFALKAESEKLLELAKRAVEMAIEEDENVAMKFIENVNLGE